MRARAFRSDDSGPFVSAHFRSGDPYEVSHGHRILCAPTGGSGSGPNALGASVVGWDPAVTEVGVDAGYSPEPKMLRAPDVAVGNVPNKPGWIQGCPQLAIEYSDIGQDEPMLEKKIKDLLEAGTRLLWVVRLSGPRRVEVHRRGEPVQTACPGEYLTAPGILQNPVLVESLYDRNAAERATLINLLQRHGYADLDAVLQEGRDEGRIAHARQTLRRVLEKRGLGLPAELDAHIEACSDVTRLDAWLDRALDAASVAEVFSPE